mmetsp:Transcript_132363/g.283045  ORF Transcript_132363/g.283045 Transcript_132363/m.283045 type:complete len:341 (-) Transcript_132363:74-1096(-)
MSNQDGIGDPTDDIIPYSQQREWKDVTPVRQEDGPEPLAVIRYPPGFEEVHDYFRAVQQRDEYSERALRLTADVIEHNSANYTAWYYRRRCLKELGSDLEIELGFADKWARDCPKNYQVWYHRRWLITEMAEERQRKAESKEVADEALNFLAERELDYHFDVMQVNDDYKNYNGWSHRQFIVQKFGLWSKEMAFVEDLLRDDIRNNSAWNHRHTVVRNTCWPLSEETRRREVDYTLKALRGCASNESAWNYLAAFFGEGEGKVPWDSMPQVEAFVREVLGQAPDRSSQCRFAVEALARVHEARGNIQEALEQYSLLKEIDQIRANYWDWRARSLREGMIA